METEVGPKKRKRNTLSPADFIYDEKKLKFSSVILDRYYSKRKNNDLFSSEKRFVEVINGDIYARIIKSPFTGKYLKPYIWRDFSSKPQKLVLLEDIQAFFHL